MNITSKDSSNILKNILLITIANTSVILFLILFKLSWDIFINLVIVNHIWEYICEKKSKEEFDISIENSVIKILEEKSQIMEITVSVCYYMAYVIIFSITFIIVYYIYVIYINNNKNYKETLHDLRHHKIHYTIRCKIHYIIHHSTHIIITIIFKTCSLLIKYKK